jgi:large subunit ribosomal protein L28
MIFIIFKFFTCKIMQYLIEYSCCESNCAIRLNNVQGGAIMAKCAICDKAVHFGNNVSHSHRRSNKIWKANVKHVKVKVNGAAQRMYVCTSCLRSGKVERA